jgi:hypothetical protein
MTGPERLTDALIKRLPVPATGNRVTWDTGVIGLGALVTATGHRGFVLNYSTRTGRRRRYTIGAFPDWSTPAAREEAKRLKRLVDQGGDPLAELQDSWAVSLHERVAGKIASFVEQGIEPQGYLYRHYGADGDLLYVGQTMSAWSRNAHHLTKANWRNFICLILVEPFATREEALAAEDEAIRAEFPKHNIKLNRPRHPLRELRRRATRGA